MYPWLTHPLTIWQLASSSGLIRVRRACQSGPFSASYSMVNISSKSSFHALDPQFLKTISGFLSSTKYFLYPSSWMAKRRCWIFLEKKQNDNFIMNSVFLNYFRSLDKLQQKLKMSCNYLFNSCCKKFLYKSLSRVAKSIRVLRTTGRGHHGRILHSGDILSKVISHTKRFCFISECKREKKKVTEYKCISSWQEVYSIFKIPGAAS